MKKVITLIVLFLIGGITGFTQVSINTDSSQPDASAGLDVKFSDKGFLMPRMTFEQRNAIPAPAEGLMVYCTNCGTNGAISVFSNGAWRTFSPCSAAAPIASAHVVSPGQIIWNWTLPAGASGSRWNTSNNFDAATDMGVVTSKTETGIACGTSYTRYVWAYNECGNSSPVSLSQTISGTAPGIPTTGTHTATENSITWHWNTVSDAIGYKWNSSNDYATATDMGTATTKNETGLTCGTTYPRFIWAYNGCGHSSANVMAQSTLACWLCGASFTKVHLASEGVAPVNKSVTYGTTTNIPGETSKCWITSNLGASHQATAVDDATEESAGWYWQFNRKQGYKHDGATRTPNTTWINNISENSDWTPANDPCKLELGTGWRIPTSTEWTNVYEIGGWTNSTGPFTSALKMHMAGYLLTNDGSLGLRGGSGGYWSGIQNDAISSKSLLINNSYCYIYSANKTGGSSLRCLSPIEGPPYVSTTAATNITQTTASGGGNVTDDGGHPVTARGVCWSTATDPTIADSHTTDGSGTGSFTSSLTGLSPNTLYYIRAYATNSMGTSYGNQVSFTTLSLAIGQSFGGGIIFYIDGTGQHGFIAATSDQGYPSPGDVITWGCRPLSIPGTLTALGTGAANTALIVANGCNNPSYAARVCSDLVLNGYDDWFLPSKDELNQLYLQRGLFSGFANSYYWCSTEKNADYTYIQFFGSGGTQNDTFKDNYFHLRAIRAF